jgi:hypothetical protein
MDAEELQRQEQPQTSADRAARGRRRLRVARETPYRHQPDNCLLAADERRSYYGLAKFYRPPVKSLWLQPLGTLRSEGAGSLV